MGRSGRHVTTPWNHKTWQGTDPTFTDYSSQVRLSIYLLFRPACTINFVQSTIHAIGLTLIGSKETEPRMSRLDIRLSTFANLHIQAVFPTSMLYYSFAPNICRYPCDQ